MMFFIKFYKLPLFILAIAILAHPFLTFLAPTSDIPALRSIASQMLIFRNITTPFLFIASLITTIHCTWELWQLENGKSEGCYNCGGIVDMKNGRYGLYYKCRICNRTRSCH